MRELDVCTLPLTGLHLVEASAGTGKTHNIGLLHVRLLLEAGLSARSIAVVTFTDAATRDLRARLRKQLVAALERLQGSANAKEDELERILGAHRRDTASQQTAEACLQRALLEFDEAQIWTLHGLCARLLADLAFETGQPFAEIEAGTSGDAAVELVRDYWRRYMVETPDLAFAAILKRWENPERLAGFLIRSQVLALAPECIDPVDPEALAGDAQRRIDSTLNDWRRHLDVGQVARAVAAIEELLASRSLSSKDKSSHHAAAMAAMKATLAADPGLTRRRRIATIVRQRDEKISQKQDHEWKPQGALAEIAACVDRMTAAVADLETARGALFVRGAIGFVQAGLQARQSRLRLHGYDDLISKLHRLLHGPEGARIAAQIAARLLPTRRNSDTDSLQYCHPPSCTTSDSGLF